jgi:hypothetical protein
VFILGIGVNGSDTTMLGEGIAADEGTFDAESPSGSDNSSAGPAPS